jgi:hypothetical protein
MLKITYHTHTVYICDATKFKFKILAKTLEQKKRKITL